MNKSMTTQNKIIIALATLIIIVAMVQIVLDYQKTEKQYRACFDVCSETYEPLKGLGLVNPIEQGDLQGFDICIAECREKYGK